MPVLRGVLHEIDLLERVQAELASIATRDDDRRRHDLIEFRRRLAGQIAAVGRVSEPLIARLGDQTVMQAYREKFSSMPTAAAMHQAQWPAVSLGERDTEYRASASAVREANGAFLAWMRDTLNKFRLDQA